jgi:hypothetical protein
VTGAVLVELNLHVFRDENFLDVRRDTSFELFELCWPELDALWDKTAVDWLQFDSDYFLDSPNWTVEEVDLGETKVLLVAPQC